MRQIAFLRELFTHYILYFPVILLFIVFWVMVFMDIALSHDIHHLVIATDPLPGFSASSYPLITGLFPPISAQAAVVMDRDSGVMIYAKNPTILFSPASTTKMMTALVGMDYFRPGDILTAKRGFDIEGSGLGLVSGEKMTFENLLYGMFLLSANDAAQMVAQNYPGGERSFVSKMNQKAKEYSLYHTHFSDPAGLMDDGDYTTATDLVHLASIVLQKPLIATISGQTYATITSVEGTVYAMANRNILLGQYGVIGGKTGFTDLARDVLATAAVFHGHTYYTVVMRSDDRFGDTVRLLDYTEKNILYEHF